jgi:hypothetical protein
MTSPSYNDMLAIAQPNMQIRSNDTLGIAGLYFSYDPFLLDLYHLLIF